MRRLVGFALHCYPRAWRDRFETEVSDLTNEMIDGREITQIGAAVSMVGTGVIERLRSARRRNLTVLVASSVSLALALTLGGGFLFHAGNPPRRSSTQASHTRIVDTCAQHQRVSGDMECPPLSVVVPCSEASSHSSFCQVGWRPVVVSPRWRWRNQRGSVNTWFG